MKSSTPQITMTADFPAKSIAHAQVLADDGWTDYMWVRPVRVKKIGKDKYRADWLLEVHDSRYDRMVAKLEAEKKPAVKPAKSKPVKQQKPESKQKAAPTKPAKHKGPKVVKQLTESVGSRIVRAKDEAAAKKAAAVRFPKGSFTVLKARKIKGDQWSVEGFKITPMSKLRKAA